MKNIIIVDDHELFRSGIKVIISEIGEFNILEAGNGKEFLQILNSIEPDIVLMDINMPEMDGIKATERALKIFPDLRILVLSMYDDANYYNTFIDLGVKGFILKDTDVQELKRGIESVLNDKTYFSQNLLLSLIKERENNTNVDLSDRELDVLKLIARGLSTQEMSDALHISFRTVERHRANLLTKTNTNNSLKLLIFAIKNRLVEI